MGRAHAGHHRTLSPQESSPACLLASAWHCTRLLPPAPGGLTSPACSSAAPETPLHPKAPATPQRLAGGINGPLSPSGMGVEQEEPPQQASLARLNPWLAARPGRRGRPRGAGLGVASRGAPRALALSLAPLERLCCFRACRASKGAGAAPKARRGTAFQPRVKMNESRLVEGRLPAGGGGASIDSPHPGSGELQRVLFGGGGIVGLPGRGTNARRRKGRRLMFEGKRGAAGVICHGLSLQRLLCWSPIQGRNA